MVNFTGLISPRRWQGKDIKKTLTLRLCAKSNLTITGSFIKKLLSQNLVPTTSYR